VQEKWIFRQRGYFFTEYPTKAQKLDYLGYIFPLLTVDFIARLCLLPHIAVAPLMSEALAVRENS
jgi:hypothetical protein